MTVVADLALAELQSQLSGVPAGMTPDEARIAWWLAARLFDRRSDLQLSRWYYDGMQPPTNLGISTPPELASLRAVMGWCQSGVDAIDERLSVNGFRLPNSTAADESLWQIWQANNLDAESPLVHLDSLIYGSAYVVVGPGDSKDAPPVITCESPIDMIAVVDTRRRRTSAAYQTYIDTDPTSETYARQRAALYLPNATIHLVQGSRGWQVADRDDHNLGVVPVVAFLNRQSTHRREGLSEITDAWRNTVDRACRTTVAMEIAREFYAIPQRYILGIVEGAFQDASGNLANVWEIIQGKMLALEANEDGTLPQVGTFATGDPSNFTKLLDFDVRTMAGLMGLAPHYLGIFNEGNPASADAIRLSDFRLKTRADRKALAFGDCWEQVMRLAVMVETNTSQLSPEMLAMETDWAPTGIPTPAADTDAMTKQVQSELVPAESDVVLSKLGYSAVERARIASDRQRAQGRADLRAMVEAAKAQQAAAQQPPTQQPGAQPAEQVPNGNSSASS
ncbi:phage portal protein [Nocardia concava]|uniref:phage portal protein n=1 Tax=Nocardia concava TaxID=257281 RepID=UPI0002F29894|nr:phage portal protein [Nocardia concava]